MVKDIHAALGRDIAGLSWMSEPTKAAALDKLNAIEDRIGYPDRWRDYSALRTARDDAFGNLLRVREWDNARDRARIGRPTDRGEWAMTPPTVNSYYSADRNSINFSAGILQPPFYASGRDSAINYGSAGGMIGHEMTHGFDDTGRKFDAQGRLCATGGPRKKRTRSIRAPSASPISIQATRWRATFTSTASSRSVRTSPTTAGCVSR